MSLNPRLIAIEGIGFTPIALAVMGLIEILQEEQQNRYGGGRKSGTGTSTKKDRAPDYSDADIERLVHEKWEAIEVGKEADRRAPKAKRADPPAAIEVPPNIAPVPPNTPPELIVIDLEDLGPQQDQDRELAQRRRAEEEAFILMLLANG